ncbi:type-F conjugative transfer system pilin assembly protein TrbC [Pelomicrobium methylotrophicum]|uniref:Type-F conjugative transfer system pilin assembly protein TrbC n=1 Tax=Pelomicrobium methylotrophicum TaxID=2602750 RepID=A0A5C7F1A3_9PROT|nr:type-F conjugative transfer system pilin assembly protein TrbC [Pelomicrobium methylotrophicum]TXF13558.1 type-F conjugative transfer system pilin assembly protein TrbC [Pelomicrobium methylotrophicum]
MFLLLASSQTPAQEPFFEGMRVPTDEEMAKAQQKAREAMGRLPDMGGIRQQHGGAGMPKIEAIPKPAATAPDIARLAEKYRDLGRAAAPQSDQPDLLVFVSLSMPRGALERIVQQAERAGATLVFRGLKDDSMMKMGQEIQAIIGNRNVSAAIHPPAFRQFSVTRVPAVVIARPEAGIDLLEDGCSKPETFVKVSGDVSLDYALDYIERKSPAWAGWAKYFRSKIVRGIN